MQTVDVYAGPWSWDVRKECVSYTLYIIDGGVVMPAPDSFLLLAFSRGVESYDGGNARLPFSVGETESLV